MNQSKQSLFAKYSNTVPTERVKVLVAAVIHCFDFPGQLIGKQDFTRNVGIAIETHDAPAPSFLLGHGGIDHHVAGFRGEDATLPPYRLYVKYNTNPL
jgi:hypothetical protein